MSSSSKLVSADLIAAAADELKRRRLSAAAAAAPSPTSAGATPKAPKGGKGRKATKGKAAARSLCKLRLTQDEYRQLRQLKRQLAATGVSASRQELVRAGLLMLVHLDRAAFLLALRDVVAAEPVPQQTA
ncbi:MAG TPA: hypothetical protein PK752_14000 [Accumulibacter sp.]|uniref:hypothetical protein n=1 Tax=Accumulibacter sp. TaxID=2053492 RepID=UPI002CA2EF87|nr:hypothetical protein [Accumulibacter sp.]HRD89349.1 hypothetical protein [Accumulibacter sp.]